MKERVRQRENTRTKRRLAEGKAILVGCIATLAVWLLAALLAALWVYFKGTGTYLFSTYIYLLGVVGVFAGGLAAGLLADKSGWTSGAAVGLLLGIVGVAVGLEVIPQAYTLLEGVRCVLVWSLWGLSGGYLGSSIKAVLKKTKES